VQPLVIPPDISTAVTPEDRSSADSD
jgi:hypothetical protein